MLPLLVLAVIFAFVYVREKQAEMDDTARYLTVQSATAIDQYLGSRIGALQILASSSIANDPSLRTAFYNEALGFVKAFGSNVILADQNMRMLVNTRVPLSSELPALPKSGGQEAALLAMATKAPAISNLTQGPVSGLPVVYVAVPVMADMGDSSVRSILLTTIEIDLLERQLPSIVLPSGWAMRVVDYNQQLIIQRAHPHLNVEKDINPSGRFVIRCSLAPWSVIIEIPRNIHEKPLTVTAVALVLAIFIAILISLYSASVTSHRIGAAVSSLVDGPSRDDTTTSTADNKARKVVHTRVHDASHDIEEIGAVRRILDQSEEKSRVLNERLQYLITVIQQLASSNSIEEIAAAIRTAARKLMNADGATFALRDNDQCFYMDEDAISPLWKGQRFPMGQCISGWAMMHRELVVIEDIYKDDRIPHDIYRPTFVKSLVMAPIDINNPRGAIGIYWARNYTPGGEELELVQMLANATSIAMNNVRSFEQLEQLVKARTKELTEANSRLQELDRLKSMFIASMSHELRTPLNSIIGFTGIMLMGMSGDLTDVQRTQLGMVQTSAKHLLDLINDVIDVSKIEAGKTEISEEPFDLAELLREVSESFTIVTAEKGISLELDVQAPIQIVSDRRRVKQILVNLIGNAVKFTEKGGITVTSANHDDSVEVRVRDTGIGIRKEDMDKLFQAFSRIYIQDRPLVEGTGLGLYLSLKLAGLLGGTITASSEPGKGSEFVLVLPRYFKKAEE